MNKKVSEKINKQMLITEGDELMNGIMTFWMIEVVGGLFTLKISAVEEIHDDVAIKALVSWFDLYKLSVK